MSLRIKYDVYDVGRAHEDSGLFRLEYDESWLRLQFFPVSASLPLTRTRWPARRAHPFFANLLPEGMARQALCERLGISVDNDVALLTALGDDTAGALRFIPEGTNALRDEPRRPITQDWLERWSEGEAALPDEHPIRLSLAGAQHKISVVREGDRWAIPATGEPSTHILKFDSERFRHLSVNEFLTTRFAYHQGLQVVEAELEVATPSPHLVVTRYDRAIRDDGVERMHQEDFCQVLALPPTRKYESEGGPGFRLIAEALRAASSSAALDARRLVRWAVFCALAGNADGHAKNLSLLYTGRRAKLTPFYDLVCTRAFPNVDRRLAFSVGGVSDPDAIGRDEWEEFSDALGVAPSAVLDEVRRQLEGWEEAFEKAEAELTARLRDSPVTAPIRRVIAKRARALQRNLER